MSYNDRMELYQMIQQGWKLEVYRPPNPAAGANLAFALPSVRYASPLSVIFTFTTTAVVGNRHVVLTFTHQEIVVARIPINSLQTATIVTTNSWLHEYTQQGILGAERLQCLPPYVLEPGTVIGTSIAAIDVGDTITAVTIFVASLR